MDQKESKEQAMAEEVIDNGTEIKPPSVQVGSKKNKPNRMKRKELLKEGSNRAYHRLCSILHDHEFVSRVLQMHRRLMMCSSWPVVANQRCGSVRRVISRYFFYFYIMTTRKTEICSLVLGALPFLLYAKWYGNPFETTSTTCYFKSTDGHKGTWNFSQKRLNLSFLSSVSSHGGCILLDASRSKGMPDSLSRTIPIWCVVLNRLVIRYRQRSMNTAAEAVAVSCFDDHLFTPKSCVSDEEHDDIVQRLEVLVNGIVESGAIDEHWLLQTLTRPLRPYWITAQEEDLQGGQTAVPQYDADTYLPIVCVSCSNPTLQGTWMELRQSGAPCKRFIYTPGAADDEESWSRGLTPELFWKFKNEVLLDHKFVTPVEHTDDEIDEIIQSAQEGDEEWYIHGTHVSSTGAIGQEGPALSKRRTNDDPNLRSFREIGFSGISIGTRRSGRPPECWEHFDAIVNVTMLEYEELQSGTGIPPHKCYLHVPVREGKKDRSELERWMSVTLIFILLQLKEKRKVLIHCAQGMDRSVAVAIAAVALFCDVTSDSMHHLPWIQNVSLGDTENGILSGGPSQTERSQTYRHTGLDTRLVDNLLGRNGRDLLLSWAGKFHPAKGESKGGHLATKESLRLILSIIQRYHDRANPTRNTMQKLNRFFMSSVHETASEKSKNV